jgi:glycosyltransferase involved in cell wall biosynthesis
MRVGLDAHMVGGQETGNETYVRGLVEGFKAAGGDVDLVVYHVGSPWTAPSARVRFQRLLTASPYVRLGLELPVRSVGQHLDVVHTTYGAPLWSAAPLVLTVHDICYVTNPEWFSTRDFRVLSNLVPRSIRKAAHVITDSSSARLQIIETYGVPEDKISSIPIGPGPGAQPITEEEARRELSSLGLPPGRPFVLTVGNLQPRKNLVRMLAAFDELAAGGFDTDLVIVGPRRYRADEIFGAVRNRERIHFTGYITDRQLAACYRCSTMLVLPSLYEGFGLPALEAMAHGIPVACSNAGALPELCGDAAVLFDPLSVDAIAGAVGDILGDANLGARLGRAGLDRAGLFTWAQTVELTSKVYERVRS